MNLTHAFQFLLCKEKLKKINRSRKTGLILGVDVYVTLLFHCFLISGCDEILL